MKLEPLMTYYATLLPSVPVGAGPYGQRAIFEVTGGAFEGPRLRGTLRTGGGDWILVDAQGVGHLDVRATFETDDGALIYVQYFGSVVLTEALSDALQGKVRPTTATPIFLLSRASKPAIYVTPG